MLPLLWWALLLRAGAGIRVAPKGDPAPEDVSFAKDRSFLDARQLPNVSEFTRVWQQRYRSERHLKEPMAPGVQLVLGIFTTPWQKEYRNVVRNTWLRQTGVCLYDAKRPDPNCSVHVAFVYGNRGQGVRIPHHDLANGSQIPDVDVSAKSEAAARREPGYFELDIPENMNNGKTFAWFNASAEAFPWATHIAKADLDTYPFLHKLVKRMSDRACRGETPYEFSGRAYACPVMVEKCHGDKPYMTFSRSCPKHRCDKIYNSLEERRGKKQRTDGEPFAFMGGPLYTLSRKLVEKLVVPGGWWEVHQAAESGRGEDMMTSLAVEHAAHSGRFCVSTWSPDAYLHGCDRTSDEYLGMLEEYANDF